MTFFDIYTRRALCYNEKGANLPGKEEFTMIFTHIKDSEKYIAVNPNFKNAFEFLKTLNADTPNGSYEGEGFRCNVMEVTTSDTAADGTPKVFEAHKDYLDIQYAIKGTDCIGFAVTDTLSVVKPYDAEKDYLLLSGECDKITVQESELCILYPEDAHIPGMCADGKSFALKKAVVKIKL